MMTPTTMKKITYHDDYRKQLADFYTDLLQQQKAGLPIAASANALNRFLEELLQLSSHENTESNIPRIRD